MLKSKPHHTNMLIVPELYYQQHLISNKVFTLTQLGLHKCTVSYSLLSGYMPTINTSYIQHFHNICRNQPWITTTPDFLIMILQSTRFSSYDFVFKVHLLEIRVQRYKVLLSNWYAVKYLIHYKRITIF